MDEAQDRGSPQPAADARGTVTPIDTATNTAGEPIDVGNEPLAIAITPDGKTVYVANTYDTDRGPYTVTPINTATSTPGEPIRVGSGPWAFAITPDGKTVYVANLGSGTVTPIATRTKARSADPGRQRATQIAITPDGKTACVASWHTGTVTPIDTATSAPGPPIPVGEGARDIAITPDGRAAYVTVWASQARSCRSR